MKRNLFILMAMAAICGALASCQSDNTIRANYSEIVLAPGETVTVEILGNVDGLRPVIAAAYALDEEYGGPEGPVYGTVDSAFTVSNIKRHKLDVTGYKIGCDTLYIRYNIGIFANGDHIVIPVTCEEK